MSLIELLAARCQRDSGLLERNMAHGDDLVKPRVVDYEFVADAEDKALQLSAFMQEHRYGETRLETTDDGFHVFVGIRMPITSDVLLPVSGLMLCLAEQFGVHYAGWGCLLQTRGR